MINSLLSFHPIFSITFIVVIALALFSFFVYKEFQRNQKFLVLRIVALSLVMISILGLLLHPTYQEGKKSEAVILLTKDYNQSKVDSLIQTDPRLKVVRTKDAAAYSNSSVLKSWHELSNENISLVVGQGIPSHALELLPHKTFQFIPSSLPKGITKLIIPNNIYVNDRTQIQGTFNATEKTKLKLIGPGEAEDSVTLDTGKASFCLAFTPKQSGKFVYSFVVESLNGSKFAERLPIEVLAERHLHILFIQKFPTADVRFLKNFLSEKEHQVVLRYQISKNNFTYEYANTNRIKIDNLRSDLLNSFDLLFIDQKSYEELSSFEKNNLNKSITNGLGIIFMLNDAKEKALNDFLQIKSKVDSKDTAHIHLPSSHIYALPVLPIEWRNDASVIAVIKNKNRILSGYFFWGQGKIGFQFIQETYRVGIAGNTNDYVSLWTTLIGNTARAKESNFKLKLTTLFPYYPNEPIDITAISAGPHPSLYSDSARIPMKENALVEDYWTGRSWAGKRGWHQLHIKQDSTRLNYFVSDTSEWKALKVANQIMDNRLYQNIPTNNIKNQPEEVPVPSFLFYFVFLISSAFLWLVPKI